MLHFHEEDPPTPSHLLFFHNLLIPKEELFFSHPSFTVRSGVRLSYRAPLEIDEIQYLVKDTCCLRGLDQVAQRLPTSTTTVLLCVFHTKQTVPFVAVIKLTFTANSKSHFPIELLQRRYVTGIMQIYWISTNSHSVCSIMCPLSA